MKRKRRTLLLCFLVVGGLVLLAVLWGLWNWKKTVKGSGAETAESSIPPPKESDKGDVLVTGYCNCGKCCGWRYSWFGLGPPVYTYGRQRGKRKEVGITASGTVATHGTVAADPNIYPFGTRLYIPGYGTGVVEDVGGAITGRHIDVWFPTHGEALQWGRRNLNVTVLPADAKKTFKP